MKERLRIGVAQMHSTPDIDTNLRAMEAFAKQAKDAACDLVLFPECAAQMLRDPERLQQSETLSGTQVQFCASLCRTYDIGVLLGSFAFAQADDPSRFSNTSVFVDRSGEIIGVYQKAHLYEAWKGGKRTHHEAAYVRPGDAKPVVVDFEGWKFGLSICYDLRFPEFYRLLVDAGAEVLCVPSAFTYETGATHWEVLLRARAIENTCYVVAPAQTLENYPGRRTWGHSMAVAPWGEIIGQIGYEPGLFVTDLSRQTLTQARTRNPSVANRRYVDIS